MIRSSSAGTILVLAILSVTACSHRSVVVTRANWSLTTGGGIYVETLGQRLAGVAVYRDGQLQGIDGLHEGDDLRWITRDYELVDHPRLAAWQQLVEKLDRRLQEPDVTANEIVVMLRELPMRALVTDKIHGWVGSRPDRAALMLDHATELTIGEKGVQSLVRLAVNSPGLTDERIAFWAGTEGIRESREASLSIARCPEAGDRSLRTLAHGIDELSYKDRTEVYGVLARRLVPDGSQAYLLVRQLEELPSKDRKSATLELLAAPDASLEFAVEVLDELDEYAYSQRAVIFMAAARRAAAERRAQRLMVTRLEELPYADRANVVLELLQDEALGRAITIDVLHHIGDIRLSDRERVLNVIIDGPVYSGLAQRACIQAAEDELSGARRKRVLNKIIDHPATEARWQAMARALL